MAPRFEGTAPASGSARAVRDALLSGPHASTIVAA